MKIIVGLGNPGKKYENTRHNMGFHAVDLLAERHNIAVNKIKFKALVGEGQISGHKVLLVKPQTYMNLSGQSVREVMAYYKVDIEDLLVIYDDLDTAVGSIRVRKKGSAGSHNGMKSVIYDLQDDGFPRIRIGIGQAGKKDWKDFVIGGIKKDEKALIEEAVTHAAEAVECILSENIDMAMNRYNQKKAKPEKAADKTAEAGTEKLAENSTESSAGRAADSNTEKTADVTAEAAIEDRHENRSAQDDKADGEKV